MDSLQTPACLYNACTVPAHGTAACRAVTSHLRTCLPPCRRTLRMAARTCPGLIKEEEGGLGLLHLPAHLHLPPLRARTSGTCRLHHRHLLPPAAHLPACTTYLPDYHTTTHCCYLPNHHSVSLCGTAGLPARLARFAPGGTARFYALLLRTGLPRFARDAPHIPLPARGVRGCGWRWRGAAIPPPPATWWEGGLHHHLLRLHHHLHHHLCLHTTPACTTTCLPACLQDHHTFTTPATQERQSFSPG